MTKGKYEQTHISVEKRCSGRVTVHRKLLIPFFDAWSRYIQTYENKTIGTRSNSQTPLHKGKNIGVKRHNNAC